MHDRRHLRHARYTLQKPSTPPAIHDKHARRHSCHLPSAPPTFHAIRATGHPRHTPSTQGLIHAMYTILTARQVTWNQYLFLSDLYCFAFIFAITIPSITASFISLMDLFFFLDVPTYLFKTGLSTILKKNISRTLKASYYSLSKYFFQHEKHYQSHTKS